MFSSIDALEQALAAHRYFADRELSTAVYLASRLRKPLLIEGVAGIGKSELAVTLARAIEAPLFRVQCYPGIDREAAVYEWNYARQLVRIHSATPAGDVAPELEREVFGRDYLLQRPVLGALLHPGPQPAVLLIERIDRAGDEFQSIILEILTSWAIEIPEFGRVEAAQTPLAVLTSGGSRALSEALQRRCIYHWMDYPDFDREVEIVMALAPGASAGLVRQACNIVGILRREPFARPPGVAETIDWVRALTLLRCESVDQQTLDQTVGCLFKDVHDIEHLRTLHLAGLLRFGLDREV